MNKLEARRGESHDETLKNQRNFGEELLPFTLATSFLQLANGSHVQKYVT